jgi:hypothetical protein
MGGAQAGKRRNNVHAAVKTLTIRLSAMPEHVRRELGRTSRCFEPAAASTCSPSPSPARTGSPSSGTAATALSACPVRSNGFAPLTAVDAVDALLPVHAAVQDECRMWPRNKIGRVPIGGR